MSEMKRDEFAEMMARIKANHRTSVKMGNARISCPATEELREHLLKQEQKDPRNV